MADQPLPDVSGLPAKIKRRWRPLHVLRSRPRLMICAAVFVLSSGILLWLGLKPTSALLLGFDLGALLFVGVMLWNFSKATPAHMRSQARANDSGRWGVLWSAVVLSAAVMVALGSELHASKGGGLLAIVIAGGSIVLSWLFMNIMFAVHYAHGYYGDYGEQHKGLEFPDTPQPDYWDFTYFALVLGMTFQVSDVQITSRYLRRIAMMHSVIAFFFNMFVIAISVNILAGLG